MWRQFADQVETGRYPLPCFDQDLAFDRQVNFGDAGQPQVSTSLALAEPLSFWGGLDPDTGAVADRRHPQHGARVAGSVLVMPFGRGSSSGSSVLAEALRQGNGPAAIVLKAPDEIIVIGVLVAAELYGTECPVVVVAENDYETAVGAGRLVVHHGGQVEPS